MSLREDLKAQLALEALESAEVQHEFEDFVVVHIPKDTWAEYQGESNDTE